MNQETYAYLRDRPELLTFVRYNPMWYRYLARDPGIIKQMAKESKKFYGKTLPQRLEKMNNQVQMFGMLMQFADAMQD